MSCSAASGLYILRCLPSILFPQGALMTTALLLLGMLLGAAGLVAALVSSCCAAKQCQVCGLMLGGLFIVHFFHPFWLLPLQVYGFFQLTQLAAAAPAAPAQPPIARSPMRRRQPRGGRPVTAAAEVPPHAFCKQGELSGVVWTVPLSRFGPEDTITEWPPTTSGPGASTTMWQAVLSQGTLVLTPLLEPQPAVASTSKQGTPTAAAAAAAAAADNGRASAAAGASEGAPALADAADGGAAAEPGGGGSSQDAPAAAPPAAPTKVGIPLDGCTGGANASKTPLGLPRSRAVLLCCSV